VTAVAFHTGLDEPLGYACRLLRKAYRRGAQVSVTGALPLLQRLDQALWTFEPLEFVPHALLRAGQTPPERLGRTPLWLVEPGALPPHREVVVNLGPEPVADAAQCGRLIELVAREPEAAAAGRRRWRHYESQGHSVSLAQQPGSGA
jgi:DNA polymerase-3 subunit chi